MPFIQSFSINAEKTNPFPFNIPAVKFAKEIVLNNQVTIFVGDNGCGKSTLLESLAYQLDLPMIGGIMKGHASYAAARLLQPYLAIKWKRETSKGFFFRAEDFSDFVNSVERTKSGMMESLRELQGNVDNRIIDEMSESMNFTLHQMRKDYGENMQAFSHGEAYLKILQTRIADKGIYLLDEPEAALSPLKQLSLIFFIMEVLKDKNAQFIIATHSPILMGIPDASLYETQDTEMQLVKYTETDHYRITKGFLDNPRQYLRHL